MKTVFITGANKGIGFATAKKFYENGYKVILSGRDEKRIIDAKKRLGEDVGHIIWDVSNYLQAESIINESHNLFGDIDIFINNAGIVTDVNLSGSGMLRETPQSWNKTMDINLTGMFFALQSEVRYMIENKIKGHIVNVCSEMAFRARADAYTISKWGVRGMTYGAALEAAPYGIIINGIAPGETATEILHQVEGEPFKIASPRGERAMPSEIAEDIFYLSQSKNIIGSILNSDGGRSVY